MTERGQQTSEAHLLTFVSLALSCVSVFTGHGCPQRSQEVLRLTDRAFQ